MHPGHAHKRTPHALTLCTLWLCAIATTGCGETVKLGIEDPCQDLASAISYRTYLCDGDRDAANARHDLALQTLSCSEVTNVAEHFECLDDITNATCDQANAAGDDIIAWLSLGDGCFAEVDTSGNLNCTVFNVAARQALVTRSVACGDNAFVLNEEELARDYGCVEAQPGRDEESKQQRQACLEAIPSATCRQTQVAEAWLPPECEGLYARTNTISAQDVCASLAVLMSEVLPRCSTLSPAEIEESFPRIFTCQDVQPEQIQAYLTCRRQMREVACTDVARNDVSILEAAQCGMFAALP